MPTPHIGAQKGDFAKTVLMPGDPLRAKFVAENFLENPKLVTSVRNIFGYTGTYKGVPVSVMASGMGMPSIGIYSYELYSSFDVENIIRIGSAGSYNPDIEVNSVVLSELAYSDSTFAELTSGCKDRRMYPSKKINDVITAKAKELDIECRMVKVHSSDQFYTTPEVGTWQELAKRTDTDCVEMESFALFHNANILGKNATCLLTISDSFTLEKRLTTEERQNSFTAMMRLALESAICL